ncbi:response regulator [Streptomyces sp. BRA346]|uniref:response regulator n=1 Tax=Streptomyces sp. BRA346 TaxID=2878199 RepID=UPI0040647E2E
MHETSRILVVDDEPSVREALGRALRREGYEVDTAGDGVAALRRIEEERPDLVLDVYVMYLRRKTEAGGEPRVVHTVRGVGYVLRTH